MNKLYYTLLGLGLAITFSQSKCLAQVNPWQDTQVQPSSQPAPTTQQTLNGGGQQTAHTGKQQGSGLPIVRMGGMANGSAVGAGSAGSAPYSFGFTGGAPSGNGGFSALPPTSTGSCLGIDILGGGGGGMGMGGTDSGAGAVGASASLSGAASSVTTGTSATIVAPAAAGAGGAPAGGGSSSAAGASSSGF